MPGKIYTRGKIQSLGALLTAMHTDFKAAGFKSILPAADAQLTLTSGVGKFVLESDAAFNPVQTKQAYRIFVETFTSEGGTSMRVAIASPEQISDTGAVASFPYEDTYWGSGASQVVATYQGEYTMGQLGKKFKPLAQREANGSTSPAMPGLQRGDVFIARDGVPGQNYDTGSTMSYVLSVGDHGVVFYVWEDTSDKAPLYSFFAVQSPVNKDTGDALVDLNSPIFCVFDCDNTGIKKFVVNEADTARPTVAVAADQDTINSSAIVNSAEQVAIKRGNKYLVTFPNRINTDRYAYTEELDMIAYTSADVIGEEAMIPVRIYGEASDRIYRAMKANGPNNTKMRLLVLVEGGGIPSV